MDASTVDVQGTRIAWAEKGAGRPLVYVHGNVGSRRWYERVMDVPGCRAVALDMPNFGESAPLPGTPSIDGYADAVAGFIEALHLRGVVLAGHSLGGAVAISVAVRRADLLSALVLVDSSAPTGLATPAERDPVTERMRVDRAFLAAALRALVPELDDMGFFSLLVDDAMRMAAPAWIGNARALGAIDYASGCAVFRKPVLVVWGRRDAIISESMARQTAEAFPRARLEMMEHVGHSPPVEDPAGFVRLLSGFIAGLGKEHG